MKKVYRLFPCPAYDLPGTEQWLEEMARQGLIFTGITLGLAVFRKAVPQSLRFRLDAAPKGGLFATGTDDPDTLHGLYAQGGWTFAAKRGDFDIYRADDPQAVELHTDPKVRALSLEAVNKRVRSRMFDLLYWVVCWCLIQHIELVRIAVLLGAVWTAATVFLLAVWLLELVWEAVALKRIQKWLLRERPLHEFPGRRHPRHRSYAVLTAVMTVLFCVSGVCGLLRWATLPKIPLTNLAQPMPFATLDTLGIPGEFQLWPAPADGSYNTYTHSSTGLAPCIIECFQAGEFRKADSEDYASLDADYFDTCSPLLARALAWETEWNSRLRFRGGYEPLEAPDLDGVDYVSMYRDHYHYLTVVMVKGTRMLELKVNGDVDFSAYWQVFADSL